MDISLSPKIINVQASISSQEFTGELTPTIINPPSDPGIPDLPYIEIDLAPFIFNIFQGRQWNLGTRGIARARYQRIGRTMMVYYNINNDEDGDAGVMAIDPTAFGGENNMAAQSEIIEAGPFCYAVSPETSSGAGDGYFQALGCALAPLGDGNARMIIFVTADAHATDGGLGNIWNMTSPDFDFANKIMQVVGRFQYECMHAADWVSPEDRPEYIGTWSPNSRNINFEAGGSQSIDTYNANEGDILKIRSASADIDFGSGPFHVNIGDYIIYTDGEWRKLES